MSSIKLDFEMTPKLKEILERDSGSLLHPSMKSDTHLVDMTVVYDVIQLPEPDDKSGILAWLGVNESVSDKFLKEYEELIAANDRDSLLHQSETPEATLVYSLCQVFLVGLSRDVWHDTEAEDFGVTFSLILILCL